MSAKRKAKKPAVPSPSDMLEAYNEAAGHLENCAYQGTNMWDNPEQMRAAYLIVAKRIRSAALRLKS